MFAESGMEAYETFTLPVPQEYAKSWLCSRDFKDAVTDWLIGTLWVKANSFDLCNCRSHQSNPAIVPPPDVLRVVSQRLAVKHSYEFCIK